MLPRILQLYSTLVDYPNEFFIQDVEQLDQSVRASGHTLPVLEPLEKFRDSMGQLSVAELQETYTRTFDLSPVCSPHVGFHLFGESYKRGSLMAMLKLEYQTYGIQEGSEIPDHLSLVLKYCSVLAGMEQERELYEELLDLLVCPGVEKMVALFAETTNPYRYLLESLSAWLAQHGKQYKTEVNPHV